MSTIEFMVVAQEQEGGGGTKISAEDAMSILVNAVVSHRKVFSPAEDQARLDALVRGEYAIERGEYIAEMTPEHPGTELPVHLVGRASGQGLQQFNVSPS